MIHIVSATRLAEADFWAKSALGLSLKRLAYDSRLIAQIRFANLCGLPDVYNTAITTADVDDYLVFIHDDVWIDDGFFSDRIIAGLQHYDVIGVAGNRRWQPYQPAWAFADATFAWDDTTFLSGAVAHGRQPWGAISFYGVTPADCVLLDGMFLAAKASTLQKTTVRFDPRFDFHLYDMDFCRGAGQQGLRLGTWPISLTHQSGGAFNTPHWQQKYQAYIEKWGS